MSFLTPLLFAVSANLDALLIGISYGIRGIRITLRSNLLVSCITLVGTLISLLAGSLVSPLLPIVISVSFGSFFLMIMGFYYIIRYLLSFKTLFQKSRSMASKELVCSMKEPASLRYPSKNNGSLGELLILGCVLSVNNCGIALSVSLTGIKLIPVTIITLFFAVILLALGNLMGRKCCFKTVKSCTDLINGFLLILLGICSL